MIKADLVKSLEKLGLTKKKSSQVVEIVLTCIKDALRRGEEIHLGKFGGFKVKRKRERVGRNPRKGTPINIPAKKVPFFKPSKVFKNYLDRR